MFFKETKTKHSKNPVLQLMQCVRTKRGPKQILIVSLGTKFTIPKRDRRQVARLVNERLLGEQSLFDNDPTILAYTDHIIKKIQTEGRWDSSRACVTKFLADPPQTVEVFIDEITNGLSRQLGPVLIGHTFWNRLQFSQILRHCGFSPSEVVTAEISILNRLIAQDSEHGIMSWLQTVALDDILEIDSRKFGKDRFYRISDKLLVNQSHIEHQLYDRERELFKLDSCIFLYDLTNTYFEGICAKNPKAQYCKNQKEKRSDCPQVVVALVLDGEGFIRRHRVFEGKMSDAKSLAQILAGLERDFKESQTPTIVFDRGMVNDENIALLGKYNNLKYIVMCNRSEEKQFVDDFQEEKMETIQGRGKRPKVKVLLKKRDDISYLLCHSEGRLKKEKAMRTSREEKLEAELANLNKQIHDGRQNKPHKITQRIGRLKERYGNVSKYYHITYTHWEFAYRVAGHVAISKRLSNSLEIIQRKVKDNEITFPALAKKLAGFQKKYPADFAHVSIHLKEAELNYQPIDEMQTKEEALEGNYLLKTNRDELEACAIWKVYTMLTRIENAFRDLKSHLGLRPNRHHIEDRVEGHIFISILAYHLLHSIEYMLRMQGNNSRWSTIKRVVSTHGYSTIQVPTKMGPVINLRKAGIPEGIHRRVYDLLNIEYEHLPVRKIHV